MRRKFDSLKVAIVAVLLMLVAAFATRAEAVEIEPLTPQQTLVAKVSSLKNLSTGVSVEGFLVQKSGILELSQELLDLSFQAYPEMNLNEKVKGLIYLLDYIDKKDLPFVDKVLKIHDFQISVRELERTVARI